MLLLRDQNGNLFWGVCDMKEIVYVVLAIALSIWMFGAQPVRNAIDWGFNSLVEAIEYEKDGGVAHHRKED